MLTERIFMKHATCVCNLFVVAVILVLIVINYNEGGLVTFQMRVNTPCLYIATRER